MAESLADALPREVQRVTTIKERWQAEMHDHPEMGAGMLIGLGLMQAAINDGIQSLASGDVLRMIRD
jgi:hypothetical protein